MLITAPVQEGIRIAMSEDEQKLFGIAKLNVPAPVSRRSRMWTIRPASRPCMGETNPRYHDLLSAFEAKTRLAPVLVNTSFQCARRAHRLHARDAYRCFMRTEMDYLVLENFLLAKPSSLRRRRMNPGNRI